MVDPDVFKVVQRHVGFQTPQVVLIQFKGMNDSVRNRSRDTAKPSEVGPNIDNVFCPLGEMSEKFSGLRFMDLTLVSGKKPPARVSVLRRKDDLPSMNIHLVSITLAVEATESLLCDPAAHISCRLPQPDQIEDRFC
mgnify:CR=1 FL=1